MNAPARPPSGVLSRRVHPSLWAPWNAHESVVQCEGSQALSKLFTTRLCATESHRATYTMAYHFHVSSWSIGSSFEILLEPAAASPQTWMKKANRFTDP